MYRAYILLILMGLSIPAATAGFYRWVDENGRVHYSDNIPPSETAQGHSELDPEGRAVVETRPAKTPEEIRQEALASLETQKHQEEVDRQSAIDRALINSFTSVDQIDALATERLSTIDGKMQETRRKLDKVKARLQRTEKRKTWFDNADRRVPTQIKLNIKEYHKQIALYEKDMARRMEKRQTTVAKLKKDKQRFIELQAELNKVDQ